MVRVGRFVGYVLVLLGATSVVGCAGKSVGDDCLASDECDSGLCYANTCLDPQADDDNDGIDNATEHKLRSHPKAVDTDKDGKLDSDELGDNADAPIDTDGDGIPDLIESLSADADLDCLPDELDDNDSQPNGDPAKLKAIACSTKGVCTGQLALIAATCNVGKGGPATCVYKAVPGYSALEACDGLDNDCDGETDEDNTFQGLKIGAACDGIGACGDGKVVCHKGKATCSSNPDGPQPAVEPELCNNKDDDCDGVTDEGFDLGGLSVGAPCLGTGECGVGKVVCGAGKPVCSSDPGGPSSEATDEICNGLDDDCDGTTDEGMKLGDLALGAACDGVGACGAGHVVCSAKGAPICSSDPGGPKSDAKPETCNGKDDNCNGQTDEGLTFDNQPLGAFCWGVGECGKGTVVCSVDGKTTCSSMPDAPGNAPENGGKKALETCDGKDDDCDGQTDEGFVYQGVQLGDACVGVGACGKGVVQCNKTGGVTCSSNPDGDKAANKFEECNNIDDDCNGVTDDGVPPTFGPKCSPQGICIGEKALPTCNAGAWSCSYPDAKGFEGPNEQTCDGKDNDCDGWVDEGLAHLWKATPQSLMDGAPSPRMLAAACAFGDAAYVAGGRVSTASGAILSGELWRVDLATFTWTRVLVDGALKRTGSAMACVPATKTTKRRLWVLAGLDADGKAAPAVEVDLGAGTVSALALAGDAPGPTVSKAVIDPKLAAIWVVTMEKGLKTLRQLDIATKTWRPAAKTPQPGFKDGTDDLCIGVDGTLYALSAPAADDYLRKLASLPSLATSWKQWPQSDLTYTGGTLVCGAAIVHVDGALKGKTSASLAQVFDPSKGAWKAAHATYRSDAKRERFGLFTSKGQLLSINATEEGYYATGIDARMTAGGQRLDAQPAPIQQAAWLDVLGKIYRVGGSTCGSSDKLCAWPSYDAHAAGPEITTPGHNGTAADMLCGATVVPDPDHGQLLGWAAPCNDPAKKTTTPLRVELSTNLVGPLGKTASKGLPTHLRPARVALGSPTDRAYVYGADGKGKTELWRIDLKQSPVRTLLATFAADKAPLVNETVALLHDVAAKRLVLFEPGKSLRVHVFDLAKKTGLWAAIGEDTTVSGGRVRIAGDTGMTDAQLVVAFPHNGPPAVSRTLMFGKTVTFGPGQLKLGGLAGGYELVWQRNKGRALLVHGDDAKGHPISRIDQLVWACK